MLATLPLVEFTEIGFVVALGVLLDTIVVRIGAGDRADLGYRTARLVAQRAGAPRSTSAERTVEPGKQVSDRRP